MKEVTKMSRLVNQLEKMFRMLNDDFFNGELDTPVITVTPTKKAYAHYTPWDAWQSKESAKREINVASGTLDRPLESIACSLLHEMCHMYNDTVLNVQDVSRCGTFHNKNFASCCAKHGLICTRTEKYGYSHTEPSDELLDWILLHDELREVEMCRVDSSYTSVGVGSHSGSFGTTNTPPVTKSNSRRYVCPCCGMIVRATKKVNVICGDCMKPMIET